MTESELKALLKESSKGVSLQCWIQPRASRTEIKGIHGDALKISLAAPPVDGKANAELCKYLSKKFAVSKSAVEITSGLIGRNKKVLISGLTSADICKILCTDD